MAEDFVTPFLKFSAEKPLSMKNWAKIHLFFVIPATCRVVVRQKTDVPQQPSFLSRTVWRQSTAGGVTTSRRYIVDINGDLPVILCEICIQEDQKRSNKI
jgi:hypothetical protein